jgi:hypothetical protein
MHEVITPVHTNEHRPQIIGAAAPAADHHLLAAAALGLVPALGAAGLIRRADALGDDAFEIEVAGGPSRVKDLVLERVALLDVLK